MSLSLEIFTAYDKWLISSLAGIECWQSRHCLSALHRIFYFILKRTQGEAIIMIPIL